MSKKNTTNASEKETRQKFHTTFFEGKAIGVMNTQKKSD